ncbi:hypothetical protein C8J57DRAFT_1470203 [Mycena rebaudengoi]|nr:hypothetical protein C8J57DRAFT_1470203 [Mycena rebaudengoi]
MGLPSLIIFDRIQIRYDPRHYLEMATVDRAERKRGWDQVVIGLLATMRAAAWAQAEPGQALLAGLGSGLRFLKPKPCQAGPKPRLSGRAGPWASLKERDLFARVNLRACRICSGVTAAGNNFETAHPDFLNGVSLPFQQFLRRLYPADVRRARALDSEEAADSDGEEPEPEKPKKFKRKKSKKKKSKPTVDDTGDNSSTSTTVNTPPAGDSLPDTLPTGDSVSATNAPSRNTSPPIGDVSHNADACKSIRELPKAAARTTCVLAAWGAPALVGNLSGTSLDQVGWPHLDLLTGISIPLPRFSSATTICSSGFPACTLPIVNATKDSTGLLESHKRPWKAS